MEKRFWKKDGEDESESGARLVRGLVAALLIAIGLIFLIGKAAWVRTFPSFWGDLAQTLAFGLMVIAAVDIYYGIAYTEKYFDRKFTRSINDALYGSSRFLDRCTKAELRGLLERTINSLGGKEKDQDDHGLYEVVLDHIVPVLGKPYRENYRLLMTQEPLIRGEKSYLKVNAVVTYTVMNPTKETVKHPIRVWGEYDLLDDIRKSELYVINRIAVNHQEKMIGETPQVPASREGRQGYELMDEITLAPHGEDGDRKDVEIEDTVILEQGAMESFQPAFPTKDVSVEVFPRDCKAEIDFFAFGETNRLPKVDDVCTWEYNGWLLPKQGFALHFEPKRTMLSVDDV